MGEQCFFLDVVVVVVAVVVVVVLLCLSRFLYFGCCLLFSLSI